MKLFRYRKLSLNTMLGIAQTKRRFRKATGLSTLDRYTNPNRIKQTLKQRIGIYNNPTMTIIRQTSRGRLPSFLGIFSKIKFW